MNNESKGTSRMKRPGILLGVLCMFVLAGILVFTRFMPASRSQKTWSWPVAEDLPRRTKILNAIYGATNVVLFYLNPSQLEAPDLAGKNTLHGYEVLESTRLAGDKANAALASIIPLIYDWSMSIDHCGFEPRRAVRIISNGALYDFLICLHCHDILVYCNDQDIAYLQILRPDETLNNALQ